jgi:RNA polymerase II subunit A C-terminal domain phosphatase SSU72
MVSQQASLSRTSYSDSIDLMMRGGEFNKPVHIINMEIKDNHEEALIAGKAMIDLAEAVSQSHQLNLDLRQ